MEYPVRYLIKKSSECEGVCVVPGDSPKITRTRPSLATFEYCISEENVSF